MFNIKYKGYYIGCNCHTYVTLYWTDGKENHIIECYDNCLCCYPYFEEAIKEIEKRTSLKFEDIPYFGDIQDFDGLRFSDGFKKAESWMNNIIVLV